MMTRKFMCVCGAAASLGFAGVALAQQDNQQNRQPGATTGIQSQQGIEDLLKDRAGVWQVDVKLNKDYWSKMRGAGKTDSKLGQPGTKTIQPGDPAKRQDDPSQLDWQQDKQQDRTGNQPALDNQQAHGSQNMISVKGFAESELVLGEPILRERIVVPMGEKVEFQPGGDAADQNRNQPQQDLAGDLDENAFRGISFIQFNKDANTYEMIFMSNHQGGMKYDTGYFDKQRNRVVFRGKSASAPGWNQDNMTGQPGDRNNRDNRDRQPGQPGQPGDWSDRDNVDRQPAQRERDPLTIDRQQPQQLGQSGRQGLDNVVVVLEIVDQDTHKVTMYDVGMTPGRSPITDQNWRDDLKDDMQDRDNELDDFRDNLEDQKDEFESDLDRRQDDLGDPNRNLDQPGQLSGQPQTTRTAGDFGTVIYEATYTRAPSSMEASIRSMLDRETTVVSRR